MFLYLNKFYKLANLRRDLTHLSDLNSDPELVRLAKINIVLYALEVAASWTVHSIFAIKYWVMS